VTRKIDKYEPYKTLATNFKVESRDVVSQPKKSAKNRK
jgi:hypothetical protein